MNKASVSDIPASKLKGKRVFVRVDFNVPLDDKLNITDDTRIRASLPTIKYLIDAGARVILVSHLGRPKGQIVESMRLNPVADRLSELLKMKIIKVDDCIGEEVETAVAKLGDGDVLLLENVRFHAEEEKNDEVFAKKLASLADIFVNDAFGTAHRAHATTEGISHYLPAYAGFLIQKELDIMGKALLNPKKPFLAIIGGAKVSSKIGVLKNLLNKVDVLAIGGGMVYTFLKAQGIEIGKSLLEEKSLDEAKLFLEKARGSKTKVILPVDNIVADKVDQNSKTSTTKINEIPSDMIGVDIGKETLKLIKEEIAKAKTIIWNGPMGIFEIDKFAVGTNEVAKALAKSDAVTIIGGGDSVSAVEKAGVADKMTHISTGGGASLEFLEGKELPGIACLKDK